MIPVTAQDPFGNEGSYFRSGDPDRQDSARCGPGLCIRRRVVSFSVAALGTGAAAARYCRRQSAPSRLTMPSASSASSTRQHWRRGRRAKRAAMASWDSGPAASAAYRRHLFAHALQPGLLDRRLGDSGEASRAGDSEIVLAAAASGGVPARRGFW